MCVRISVGYRRAVEILVISYRTIKKGDVAEIQSVARKAWMHTYRETVPVTLINRFLSERYSDSSFERVFQLIAKDSSQFNLAVDGQKIVGYANVRRGQRGWELYRIYLLPEYIGKGVGKRLLKLGEQFFKKKNARKYYVYVYSRNKRALDFYSKNGFVRVKEKDKKPELYFEKRLD